ncbi:MAG: capsular biosynthesis protein [Bacteroidales bacterium]|nr:capsular biosynthesis protein [Bacteroidales bacterium]
MFFFSKKYSIAEIGLLEGGTDCHSHLLWGVDDGVHTAEDALSCLQLMEQQGLKTQWFTPHIMEDVPNKVEHLKTRFAEFEEQYTREESPTGHKIQLHLGAEYMMDGLFTELLSQGEPLLTTYDKETLLVETSTIFPPLNMDSILEQIKAKGYRPMLAHPERYLYMKKEDYKALYYKGTLFQLNLASLTGAYGPMERDKAKWLLENNMYYIYGTDTHRLSQLKSISQSKCLRSKTADLLLNLKA